MEAFSRCSRAQAAALALMPRSCSRMPGRRAPALSRSSNKSTTQWSHTASPGGRWKGQQEPRAGGRLSQGKGRSGHSGVSTFTVDAMAPGPSRHGHLVLLAAGVTTLPAETRGTSAVACVRVTAVPRALAACGGSSTVRATVPSPQQPPPYTCGPHSRRQPCSGSPQWPEAHWRHCSPPAPGGHWHCPLWG